ncbi:ATP-binding protein [Rhodobacteraceae bacterium D3-12]|nr:ATP-binding protein [Rhodobacteraceae bacterium D3-12]
MPTANHPPTLHLLFGLPGAGKSTLSQRLASAPACLRISEDHWLSALFDDQLSDLSDYQRCAAKLHSVMAPQVETLLGAGLSVVLDFPANTPETRAAWRSVATRAGARVELHHLATPRDTCLARLRARNASGAHPFTLTDAQFDRLCGHITPPSADEGFRVTRHAPDPAPS